MYNLHYNAGVKICDDVHDMTRIERLVILHLGQHYREKEQQSARASSASAGTGI